MHTKIHCIQKFTLVHKKLWKYKKRLRHAFVWLSKHFLVQKYNHHLWNAYYKVSVPHLQLQMHWLNWAPNTEENNMPPTQHCCLAAKSPWNLKISGTFKQLSSAIKILHTKSILKGRREAKRDFSYLNNSPRSEGVFSGTSLRIG